MDTGLISVKNNIFQVKDFKQFADSPYCASVDLQLESNYCGVGDFSI